MENQTEFSAVTHASIRNSTGTSYIQPSETVHVNMNTFSKLPPPPAPPSLETGKVVWGRDYKSVLCSERSSLIRQRITASFYILPTTPQPIRKKTPTQRGTAKYTEYIRAFLLSPVCEISLSSCYFFPPKKWGFRKKKIATLNLVLYDTQAMGKKCFDQKAGGKYLEVRLQ